MTLSAMTQNFTLAYYNFCNSFSHEEAGLVVEQSFVKCATAALISSLVLRCFFGASIGSSIALGSSIGLIFGGKTFYHLALPEDSPVRNLGEGDGRALTVHFRSTFLLSRAKNAVTSQTFHTIIGKASINLAIRVEAIISRVIDAYDEDQDP